VLKEFYRGSADSTPYSSANKFTCGEGSPVRHYTKQMIALLTAILCRKKDYAEKKIEEIRPLFADLLAEGEETGAGSVCKDEGEYLDYAKMIKGMYEGNEEFMKDANSCRWWDYNGISGERVSGFTEGIPSLGEAMGEGSGTLDITY